MHVRSAMDFRQSNDYLASEWLMIQEQSGKSGFHEPNFHY